MNVPSQFLNFIPLTCICFGELKVVFVPTPSFRAAAITNGLNVEPAWKPSMPPYCVDTLTFCQVSPSPLPSLVRLCAMATISPLLG